MPSSLDIRSERRSIAYHDLSAQKRTAMSSFFSVGTFVRQQLSVPRSAVLPKLGQFCQSPVGPCVPTLEYLAVLWVHVVLALSEGVDLVRSGTLEQVYR